MLDLARECWARVLAPDEPPKGVAEMILLLSESLGLPNDDSSTTLDGTLACVAEQAGVSLDRPDPSGASHETPHQMYATGVPQHVVGEEPASSNVIREICGPTKRRYVDEVDKRTLNHNGGTKSRKVHTIGEKAEVIVAYDAIVAEQGGLSKGAKGKVEKDYCLGQGMLGRWLSNREEINAAASEECMKARRCIMNRGSLRNSPKELSSQVGSPKSMEASQLV